MMWLIWDRLVYLAHYGTINMILPFTSHSHALAHLYLCHLLLHGSLIPTHPGQVLKLPLDRRHHPGDIIVDVSIATGGILQLLQLTKSCAQDVLQCPPVTVHVVTHGSDVRGVLDDRILDDFVGHLVGALVLRTLGVDLPTCILGN